MDANTLERLAAFLNDAGDDRIGCDTEIHLTFAPVKSGISCSFEAGGSRYSDDYPYAPADGVDGGDLPLTFIVPADECDDENAWLRRGHEALGAIDVAETLQKHGFLDLFEDRLRDFDAIEIELEATEHPMDPKSLLATFARYLEHDIDATISDISEVIPEARRELGIGW